MRPNLETGIEISALVPHVGGGVINRVSQNGSFRIPNKGLGRYSLPRAIRKIRETQPNTNIFSTKAERRQWNLSAQLPKR